MLAFIAAIPIVFLVILLTGFKKPAFIVAPLSLVLVVFCALLVWQQDVSLLILSAWEGFLYAVWPIGIIIFGSVSLSNLMIKSGSVKEIENLIGTISNDVRIMVVLVAWGMESFLEAIAGFGSGLALPISILTTMGVNPIKAGVVALLANSVPTAYGGVGIGITTLANVSGVPLDQIMSALSWQLLLPSIVMPFVITYVITESWAKVREIFWVPLCAGLGQAIGLMLPLETSIVAVISGLLNIGGGIGATFLFYPHLRTNTKINGKQALRTLFPFLIAVVLLLFTGPFVPPIHEYLSRVQTVIYVYPGAKPLSIKWIADAGVLLLLSGIIGAFVQGLKWKEISSTLGQTFLQLRKTLVVLTSILAMARIMTYSGMIDSLSQGFAYFLGGAYPLFAPVLGTVGVFVTGSVASSNILMGALQAEMGKVLEISPAWLVAMNASGATAGKMLAPHSVAIVMAALGPSQDEGRLSSQVFKILLIYVGVMMIISYIGGFFYL